MLDRNKNMSFSLNLKDRGTEYISIDSGSRFNTARYGW